MSKTVVELTKDLLAAPSACAEIKEAAKAYLDAIGTEKQPEAAKMFLAEIEEDIIPIDGLIAFAESEMGAKVFGDGAQEVIERSLRRKAAGEKYCDCPACAACEALLAQRDNF